MSKSKAKKKRDSENFSKLREKIIKDALKKGLTLENLFTYDPPVPPRGQERFPSIFSVCNGR